MKGLTLDSLTLQLAMPDARPALVLEDAEDVVITGLAAANTGAEPLLQLSAARTVLLQLCRPQAHTFLSVAGKDSTDIALTATTSVAWSSRS